jgi:NAD+ synthase
VPAVPHDWLSFDVDRTLNLTTGFLADRVDRAEAEVAVVGLSGGLDSATTLTLAVEALGPANVEALTLPGPTSTKRDERLAREAAEAAGVELDTIQIGPSAETLEDELGIAVDRTVRGNLQARLRMAAMYARANAHDGLVIGTGNKSELLTGYFTKYGDGGVDLLPLGDVYKTQERVLAAELGVPEAILERPPTAGLWEGQTDEDELGLAYTELDVVLAGLERGQARETIAEAADVGGDEVARVEGMVAASEHKRATAPIAERGAASES